MRVVAVDPGQKGGIAIVDLPSGKLSSAPMPVVDGRVDTAQLYHLFGDMDVLVVENIQLRGRNAGNMTTAANWGRIWAPAERVGIPVVFVDAKQWQRSVHGKATSDKEKTIKWALRNGLPVPKRPRGAYHDGVADAWGIMRWYLPRSEIPFVVKERPEWAL